MTAASEHDVLVSPVARLARTVGCRVVVWGYGEDAQRRIVDALRRVSLEVVVAPSASTVVDCDPRAICFVAMDASPDGWSLLRRILAGGPDRQVVVGVADGAWSDVERARSLGACGFLMAPIRSDDEVRFVAEQAVERRLLLERSELLERALADREASAVSEAAVSENARRLDVLASLPYREAKVQALGAFERAYFEERLRRAQGNISEAARQAGLDRSNFRRAAKRAGVVPR